MIICPTCNKNNHAGTLLCKHCGSALFDTSKHHATVSLGDTDIEESMPAWGSAIPHGIVSIEVQDTGEEFCFSVAEFQELRIGRKDPHSQFTPEIDLSTSGAIPKGVSRSHATLIQRDGTVCLMDNNSSNGTYLNGERLIAHQERLLRDGDDIRLGYLMLHVSFKKVARTDMDKSKQAI